MSSLPTLPVAPPVSGSVTTPAVPTLGDTQLKGEFFAHEKGSAESITAGLGEKPAHSPCGMVVKAPPLQSIGLHLCAYHIYASEPNRHVLAHHFCSHISSEMHQCVIYDSNQPNARLIGIEYLISERLFHTLPEEEKKYWHSHQYEVGSGMLTTPSIPEKVERAIVQEVANMYGKTIHTWQVDRDPLPLGPPSLMMSLTCDSQLLAGELQRKDMITGGSTSEQKKKRADLEYKPKPAGVDQWATSGQGVTFQPALVDVRDKMATVTAPTGSSSTDTDSKAAH